MTYFWGTFGLIFAAELPDKTAFASVLLATRSNPWAVFLGSALAFALHAGIAVALGSAVGLLPARPVQIAAGALFILIGAILWFRKPSEEEAEAQDADEAVSFLRTAGGAFGVIFVAEWGDLTQFAIAAVAARTHAPVSIFWASTLALWSVCAIGIVAGFILKETIPARFLTKAAAIVFAFVGAAVLFKAAA